METEHIEYDIRILMEKSYRRGFIHGFHSDKNTSPEKVKEWRYGDLTIKEGAPGTNHEGLVMADFKKIFKLKGTT